MDIDRNRSLKQNHKKVTSTHRSLLKGSPLSVWNSTLAISQSTRVSTSNDFIYDNYHQKGPTLLLSTRKYILQLWG